MHSLKAADIQNYLLRTRLERQPLRYLENYSKEKKGRFGIYKNICKKSKHMWSNLKRLLLIQMDISSLVISSIFPMFEKIQESGFTEIILHTTEWVAQHNASWLSRAPILFSCTLNSPQRVPSGQPQWLTVWCRQHSLFTEMAVIIFLSTASAGANARISVIINV